MSSTATYQPNIRSFASVYKACGELGDLQILKQVHATMSDNLYSVYTATSLITAYARCNNNLTETEKVGKYNVHSLLLIP